tara:strand:+ start:1415 stop:1564 length:150 start_codon:yes stop_codon:yes gene_type:complete
VKLLINIQNIIIIKILGSGVKIVPNPNPEKKVRIAAKKATKEIIAISII